MKRLLLYFLSVSLIACSGGASNTDGPDEPGTGPDNPPVVVDDKTICIDAPLVVDLKSAPELGTSGCIRVFDSSDNQVDLIDLADLATVTIREDGQMIPKTQIGTASVYNTFMDAPKCASNWRIVHYTPLLLDANLLIIRLHSGALDFGKEYYLTMDEGVIKGHTGISKGDFTFKTKAKPDSKTELSVRKDGKGDFCTVQAAVTYSYTLGRTSEVVINIAAGTYNETVFIRDKNNLTLKGESKVNTTIAYANNESYENGCGSSSAAKPVVGRNVPASGGRGVILAESCDNLKFENLTMKNTFGSQQGQAEVIYFNSKHKMTIENCNLLSLQDTFLCKGIVWVHNSLIAGHCDFIWGYPQACLFEDCEIRSERTETGGFIVQARVQNASDKGFVFLNCNLTGASNAIDCSMRLARSAGQTDFFDNVTYVNCTMSSVIAPTGWWRWPAPNPSPSTATSGWKEYGSKDASGKALDTSERWGGKVLTAEEAAAYSSRAAVLGF